MSIFLKQAVKETVSKKSQRFEKAHYLWYFLWIESQMVIRSSRIKYKVHTWGGWSTQDNFPTLKLGDACLLGPMRSNPVIPTKGVSNHNELGARCKQKVKFTSPGETSLWHHWWPQLWSPKLKVSPHRSGKGSSTMKCKILHGKQGQSLQRRQATKETLHFHLSPSSTFTQVLSPHTQESISTLSAFRSHVQSIA